MGFAPRRQDISAPNIRRIHCIGDSIMHGAGITFEESLPVQLEQALHQEFPNELFSCINFGHDCWNVWNSILHHETLYPNDACDFLILSLCANDCEFLGSAGISYSPDKVAHWQDDFLYRLVDRGLAEFKKYTTRQNIPAFIIYYEPYWEPHNPIRNIIADLCAKNALAFLDVTQSIHEQYHVPAENLYVSAVDRLHPTGASNQLAARIISKAMKAIKNFDSGHQNNILDILTDATQTMLNKHCSPQDVFAWASRTAHAKALCLPRHIKDSNERQTIKNQINEVRASIHSRWMAWQKSLWNQLTLQNIQTAIRHNVHLLSNTKSYISALIEMVQVTEWAKHDDLLSNIEKYAVPLLKEGKDIDFSVLPSRLQKIIQNLAQIDIHDVLMQAKDNPELFIWPETDNINNVMFYFKNWVTTVRESLHRSLHSIELLLHTPEAKKQLTQKYWQYVADLIQKISEQISEISENIVEQIKVFGSSNPIIGVDAYITVRTNNPSTDLVAGGAIACKIDASFPTSIHDSFLCQLIDNRLSEQMHHIRLPFFINANIEFLVRWGFVEENQLEKFGFNIINVTLKPAFADPHIPVFDIINLDLRHRELSTVKLQDFFLKI
jgi:hypothetical protein